VFAQCTTLDKAGTHILALRLGHLVEVADGQLGKGGGQGCCHKELALQEIASQRRAGEEQEVMLRYGGHYSESIPCAGHYLESLSVGGH